MHNVIELDGATLYLREEDGRWVLDSPDEEGRLQRITGDWYDWLALANHIVATDEIRRREENGDIE